MNLRFLFNLLTFVQFLALSQNSHVQVAKQRIRTEVRSALGQQSSLTSSSSSPPHYYNRHHGHYPQQHHHHHHKRWSGRRYSIVHHGQQPHYSPWSRWSACGGEDCVKRRERYCRLKRKCGHTKHVEERKCWRCHTTSTSSSSSTTTTTHHAEQSNVPSTIVINAAAAAASGPHVEQHTTTTEAPIKVEYHVPEHQPPVEIVHPFVPRHIHDDIDDSNGNYDFEDSAEHMGESDFYVLKSRRKVKRQRRRKRPMKIVRDDYDHFDGNEYLDEDDDDDNDDYVDFTPNADISGEVRPRHIRHKRRGNKMHLRSIASTFDDSGGGGGNGGIEGDIFQYEDFDFEPDGSSIESYEQHDYDDNPRNVSNQWQQVGKERATPEALIPRHRRIYSKWSRWTKCSPKCTTRRYKKCRVREQCGREVLREIAYCYTEGSFCQQWLQAQAQKTSAYDLRPVTATRRMGEDSSAISNNAIVSDYIMNGKGYRGPEYTPMKLKCGIPPIRSHKRNMYNMLKIIGGKASRKGEWPWQVAIFNRFKEAFCGGTLIAPQWVLTAAHCVRKVLYVRIGEHNLDYEDGTEVQLRVLKSYKHPSFDKKTVDSDVALLRLPKPVNTTTWIGFSCLPRPYQPLPKNVDCTVIGWGKRRNRDIAGTSVLHQAEVPIITMNSCRRVYHDYTITKNMFCAGHERGRIDTCAGDSGGPLLCRDTTKPNHPWTIFGITSFGDGCAKRNKFGIYAKVPNYVDWVWSVINCNGNCKLHQRASDQ